MYKKILVTLDASKLAECVLPHVETLAAGTDAEVVLLSVGEPTPEFLGDDPEHRVFVEQAVARLEVQVKDYLGRVAKELQAKGVKAKGEFIPGNPAEEILDYAKRNNIDLIAMATHGRSGVGRWVRGSVADKVLHSSPVPVLLVRAPGT
ncbi:MAG TPA: universal stress protein [Dehalococcoidia bacterium]|nr:universal stress protein [Dehalococcoidia bacterium]